MQGILSRLTTDKPRETPHLQDEVPANKSDYEVAWQAPRDCTVNELTVWHVPGSESALRTRPVIRRYRGHPDDPDGWEDTEIPNYGDGERFITGEPQGDRYLVDAELREGDKIVVIAENTNANYAYRFRALPTVDFLGGLERVLGVFA